MDKIQNNLQFLECIRFTRHKTDFSTRDRAFCVLGLRLKGYSDFTFDNKTLRVDENSIIFIPENAKYSQSSSREEIICVHFTRPKGFFCDSITVFTPNNISLFRALFISMHASYSDFTQSGLLKASSEFFEICALLHKNYVNHNDGIITQAVKYIQDNYCDCTLSVKDACKEAKISETYFRRLFATQYKQTPVQYITSLRIRFACSLLRGNHMTIEEVAALSGFSSAKYFSRVFKEITGTTPARYGK